MTSRTNFPGQPDLTLTPDPVGDWLDDNIAQLEQYRHQYVALTADGVFAAAEDYAVLCQRFDELGMKDEVDVMFVK